MLATRSTLAAPQVPPAPTAGLVEVVGATKTYAGAAAPALDDVTLRVEPGEFFSLLGPSGSGKTTTLRLIAGFEAPDRGAIRLGGSDVTALPPFKRDVHTVFQNYALFPHLSAARNVAYPLRMRKVDKHEQRRRVADALALVDMSPFADRLPHELSGGQRQRIALARALISRPQVVLLDEPLGALDLQLRHQMQAVLMELQREVGCTFVYVTHDQGEALGMSDRLAVMHAGRIEQLGPPADVYYEPATSFVASFIGKSNVLAGEGATDGPLARADGLVLRLPRAPRTPVWTASVRYEAVEVCPVGGRLSPRSTNTFEGTVENLIFLGDGLEVTIAIDRARLVARVPAQRADRLERGDRVQLGIASEDIVVLDGGR
jgi:spermidine/putrescine transport system ATP-binding protein